MCTSVSSGNGPLRQKAFTLIELLIVIAIIAILALIAVPNFLEAQTRAKVSRVVNDHRALATALDAYFLDHGAYPRDHDNYDPGSRWDPTKQLGWFYLTTPMAYITNLAEDPFMNSKEDVGREYRSTYYILGSGSDNQYQSGGVWPNAAAFHMNSIGVDMIDDTDAQDDWPFSGTFNPNWCSLRFYDPTNGTMSRGDIYRFGGDYRQGNYKIFDKVWWEWGQFGPTSMSM